MASRNCDATSSRAETSAKIWRAFSRSGMCTPDEWGGFDFGMRHEYDIIYVFESNNSVDAELLYAKSLSKMASKLNKACRDIPGSLAEGWRGVAAEMESRSEVHRLFSTSMVDEIVKPLKSILENQHKTRKAVSFFNSH